MEQEVLTCEEIEDLLPAYVLGALSAGETAAVARHVQRCFDHVESLQAYAAVGDGLAASVPMAAPPAGLRARLLASVAKRSPAPRSNERRVRFAWAAVAAAAMMAIVLGAWGLSLQRQIDGRAVLQARFLELARQPGAHMVPLETAEGIAAKGVLIYTDSEAAVWAVALPRLQGEQVFQCWWVDRNGARVSGGSFVAGEGPGFWFIPMPDNPEDLRQISITLEPDDNSTDPEGPPVLSGGL